MFFTEDDIPISKMKPGDGFICNDSLRTGTHVNDVRLLRPIFYKGEPFCIAFTAMHWADIGGPEPGTFNPRATSAYAEGLRIPPINMITMKDIMTTV